MGRKLISCCIPGAEVVGELGQTGFGRVRSDVKKGKYSRLARTLPVLVLVDLDQKPCAPVMRSEWFGDIPVPEKLVFRIVVREAESWLLADRQEFARFLGIPSTKIALQVEQIAHPKEHLLKLVDRHGNRESKRILPPKGSKAVVSPNYNTILTKFVERYWNPRSAAANSPSLKKALERISGMRG